METTITTITMTTTTITMTTTTTTTMMTTITTTTTTMKKRSKMEGKPKRKKNVLNSQPNTTLRTITVTPVQESILKLRSLSTSKGRHKMADTRRADTITITIIRTRRSPRAKV